MATSRSIPAADEPDLLTVQGDITDAETSRRVVERALERFGRIDSLINNAGVYIGKPSIDYTSDDFAAITAVNLAGFFHITQRAIRPMLTEGAGHIVNISTSLVDHADSTRPSALASLTKGALVAVTRSLAIEYAARGVRVNAVSLGVIRTPVHDPLTDFRGDLPKIAVPTLVLRGTADRTLPFEATAGRLRDERLIADLTFVEVADGPHNIGWTHPDEINAGLLDFFGGISADRVPTPAHAVTI